ncbi:MAG TPA: hypothetical protein PLP88_09375, partial [Bacteroidales bacterium]|nr:hypothetical protein [Bacteroidales bacterium]
MLDGGVCPFTFQPGLFIDTVAVPTEPEKVFAVAPQKLILPEITGFTIEMLIVLLLRLPPVALFKYIVITASCKQAAEEVEVIVIENGYGIVE